MKRISTKQSRRNSARRQRKVKARHRQAGHWSPQAQPMFTSAPVHYEIGAHTDAMSYGGIGVVHRLVTKLGLPEQIDERLRLLKVHLPYHESDHVLNLAYNALCGGTRLQDIEMRRHDTAYMNALGADLIPDPTTTGDFCRRFQDADVVDLMEAINAVRPKMWQGRGKDLLADAAYLDVDGVMAPTGGERKQGMNISYKGIWGYHPLIVSLANTKEVLYVVNRPGNVPSHTDAAAWIDKAIARLEPHAHRICLRGDTNFSLTKHFDRWAERVDFVFGFDCTAVMRTRAEALEEACWQRLERGSKEETLSEQRRRPGAFSAAREGAYRRRAGLRERPAQLRRRGRVRLSARRLPALVPGGSATQEPEQDEGRTRALRGDPLFPSTSPPHRPERGRSGRLRQPAV